MVAPVRSREDFAALARSRARGRAGAVWVTWAPHPADRPADPRDVRVAYAVSKKVGTAVVRNRIRRRLRAMMAELDADGLRPGLYLVGVRPDVVTLSSAQLRARLAEALPAVPDHADAS